MNDAIVFMNDATVRMNTVLIDDVIVLVICEWFSSRVVINGAVPMNV